MKRLGRGILWGTKALLLTVALAALVLWASARRYSRCVTCSWYVVQPVGADYFQVTLGGGKGRIFLDWDRKSFRRRTSREYAMSKPGLHWEFRSDEFGWDDRDFFRSLGPSHWWADEYDGLSGGPPRIWRYVNAPYWFVIAVMGCWPSWGIVGHLRHRARRRRYEQKLLCPSCGYDLRATPDRCPECGKVPRAAARRSRSASWF